MITVWSYLLRDAQVDYAWSYCNGSVDVVDVVNFFEPVRLDDYSIFLRHNSSGKIGASPSCQKIQLLTTHNFDDSNQSKCSSSSTFGLGAA